MRIDRFERSTRIAREAVRHPEQSLRCLHLEQAAFRGGLHRHGHLELTWIERGRGLRWVGDGVEPFFDGDLVLVGSDLAHQWATHGPQPAGGCAATVVQFPPEWAARTGLPELARVAVLVRQAGAGLEVQGRTRDEVVLLMRRLRAAGPARRIGAFVEILGALLDGAADLRALSARRATVVDEPAARDAASGTATRGRRIDRVLNWIEAHLADELRVADAAALAHVSPAAFARFFRREVGKGFVEYVNDARCGWAALRLLEGREPIADIALGCGFASLSNFGEQFRRRYGASPRAFRQPRSAVRTITP